MRSRTSLPTSSPNLQPPIRNSNSPIETPISYSIFKPDGLGDFVLATGAIHTLAREVGEENLTLCVHQQIADLAKSQFPKAHVIGLPLAAKRRILNLFVANAIRSLRPTFILRRKRYDCAISLRHLRCYLQTFIFFFQRARRFIVGENLLARSPRVSRRAVERGTQLLRRPQIAPFAESPQPIPLELETHRRVLELALKRPIKTNEVLPLLHSSRLAEEPYWVCSPFSTDVTKDFPVERWCEVFSQVKDLLTHYTLYLCGSITQTNQLNSFAKSLTAMGIPNVCVATPPRIPDFVDLVASSSLVLTIDTGASHIATALDKRCIILFSGLHRLVFGPWQRSSRQQWLEPQPLKPDKEITMSGWHKRLANETIVATIRSLISNQ